MPVWHHPSWRLPVPVLESYRGIEPRRADLVLWSLEALGAAEDVRVPAPVSWADLGRVHTAAWLEAITHEEALGRVLGLQGVPVPVDAVLQAYRTACGAVVEATREALARRGPTLSLLGGFHHAWPDRGGGLCAVNDIAVAVAVARAEGLAGTVAVIDLDAHPPDGLAACAAALPDLWIGSLTASDWGLLDGVDETLLPEGTGDDAYLEALDALLARMPRPVLAFVIAGGDVLAGDRHGLLALSTRGARRRDRRVAAALEGIPSVWLPGGGYHADAWKLLAGTALVLRGRADRRIPDGFDPLHWHFSAVHRGLRFGADEPWITEEDLEGLLGPSGARAPRLLGFYTAQGIEVGLWAYGVLPHYERLGYRDFRVELEPGGVGDRYRLYGQGRGATHLLIECEVARQQIDGRTVLFVNWLTLRHPLGRFTSDHPRLPNQDVPGPGLAREAGELMARVAERLGLDGVAFRPASFHVAYAARHRFHFVDPERQARFEALIRDLAALPLRAASRAVAEGRVRLDGAPYAWEAEPMVWWRAPHAQERAPSRARFTVDVPAPAAV